MVAKARVFGSSSKQVGGITFEDIDESFYHRLYQVLKKLFRGADVIGVDTTGFYPETIVMDLMKLDCLFNLPSFLLVFGKKRGAGLWAEYGE